ncbi:MAG: hypothetical protein PHG61_11245 [Candidatus Marinimicrobia bacterium]|nr:hypothetical protein [Candidatus Neomarinimicrobiota bacterium]
MNIDSIQLSPIETIRMGMSHPEPFQPESGQSLFSLIPKGAWKGHRCFIIGGGPTVLTHNLDRLAGELTIGVNRAYDVYYPSILCALDPQFYEWAEDGAFGIFSEMRYRSYPGTKAWARVRPDTSINASGIYNFYLYNWPVNNSGQAAINLAIELGASPIYLIGFDLKGNPINFHDGYPTGASSDVYDGFIESIERYVPEKAKEHGVEVINLSPDSALTIFPFADFDEVLDSKPVRPVIISCYEKGDEQDAAQLVQSAMLYGLECDVIPAQMMKEELIQSMIDKHRRPVLYFDCRDRITHERFNQTFCQ